MITVRVVTAGDGGGCDGGRLMVVVMMETKATVVVTEVGIIGG